MRPKIFQGYVVLLLVTTLGKFQIFVTIFAHSTTPINEVCLEPLSPSCGHGVKSTFLLGQPNGLRFCYTQSRSVETRSSSNIVLSCLYIFPILLNLIRQVDYIVPIFGLIWPFSSQFSTSNSAKLLSRRIEIEKLWNFLMSTSAIPPDNTN